MTDSVRSEIRAANVSHYGDGDEIERYLDEPHHAARIRAAIKQLVRLVPPSDAVKGIELGAGTGRVASMIKGLGYNVVAVDASEEMLEQAMNRGLATLQFDASGRFPLPDGGVQFVFAGELIEHIFDTRRFLSECFRVLCRSGVLILTTPNLATLNDRARFLFGASPRHVDALHDYLHLHIRPFTASSLRRALSVSGFENIAITSHLIEIGGGAMRVRSRHIAHLLPGLGKTLIATARRGSGSAVAQE